MFVLHVKGMASACSIVLCLSVHVLCHHQVFGFFFLSLPRIRSLRKVLVSVSDGKCQPSKSGEVSGGESAWLRATLGYVRRSGLCVWMEIYKDAFRSVGVLTGDASPQSLAPADKLSEQDAICSEHLSSSRLCFVRDGSCSECIKYFNRHFFKPWISNYI